MKITFYGGAGEVTGSQHLVECNGLRFLLDCGLFQGRRAECREKNQKFLHKASELDAVILSHAHIDHCGNLPSLYRDGFRGDVYCTPATADIAQVMLADAAKIQAEDAKYLNRKRAGHGPEIKPLYTNNDVQGIAGQMVKLQYGKWHDLYKGFRLRFRDAGHVLGSAICELEFEERGEVQRLVFTGDLGRRGMPLLNDPELVNGCDVLITESTYGNRVHAPVQDIKTELKRIIGEAEAVGGRVIIPAFSLGRTQQLVYFLNQLYNAGELPRLPMFVDSPLSRRLTNVYREHTEVMDSEVLKTTITDKDPFGFDFLEYLESPDDSRDINFREGPLLVIAASGMCESGRVLHHLKHSVESEHNTIVIMGFQAEHTLGRRIVERRPRIKIFDREYDLKAKVEVLDGLSAHADVNDFKWWFDNMGSTTGIGQAFIVHGEIEGANGVASLLKDVCDEPAVIPQRGQSFEIPLRGH